MATAQPPSSDERKALLSELNRGAQLIFSNAEQLSQEAETLRLNDSFARSLFLHQISMEECAKIEMIGGWATTLLMGKGIDLNALATGFRSHKAKNHTNAYMARVTEEELEARNRGDWKESAAAFKRFQERFHDEMNTVKNASLYVDFKDGEFSAPSEMITEEVLKMYCGLNQYFLRVTSPYLGLLKRIEDDDGAFQEALKVVTQKLEDIREKKPDDLDSAMEGVLDEMLKVYMEERRNSDQGAP